MRKPQPGDWIGYLVAVMRQDGPVMEIEDQLRVAQVVEVKEGHLVVALLGGNVRCMEDGTYRLLIHG